MKDQAGSRRRHRPATGGERGARFAVWLLVPLLAAILGGCSAQPSGAGVIDQGYVSGDGSVRQWAVADRGAAVEVAGTDLAGSPVSTADWAGDVVVLNTWYAACAPCRAEAPDLAALSNARAADGVHLLGINVQDSAETGQAFERRFAIPYPSIEDSAGRAVAGLSGVVPLQAVPTTVVLDRDHRPAARILGRADPSTLSSIIDEILAEPAGSGSVQGS